MVFKVVLLLVGVSCLNAEIVFDSSGRISNSPIATGNQQLYSISLQRVSELPNQVQAHLCGGALFTLQHALTLAHCVTNTVNNIVQVRPASEFRVFAGDLLLANENANRIRNIANFTVHPGYIPYPAQINDIAIITLQTAFLNTTVVPIPLPVSGSIPVDFTECNLAGWGAANTSVLASNELRATSKFIFNIDRCTSVWDLNPSTANVFPNMICAASLNIVASGCTGDQGNALICNGQLTGLLFLTNNCQLSSYPEVYTRVSNYTTWIRSISGANDIFRPELGVLAFVAIVCMKIFS